LLDRSTALYFYKLFKMWINLLNVELQKVGRTIEHRMTKEKTMNIERLKISKVECYLT
jgi:hypothetical protein